MKHVYLLAAALIALPAGAQTIDATDRAFLTKDAEGGLYELAIAGLAQQRTSRDDVRAYATRLIMDHGAYNQALAQLAQSKGVDLPTEMTADDRVRLNSINGQAGSTADASFIEEANRINDEDAHAASDEAAHTSDPDIKAFLSRFAAMDDEHGRLARALRK